MAEVRITIIADDQASGELDALKGRLESVDSTAEDTAGGMRNMGDGVSGLSNTISRGFDVMTRLDLTMLSLQASTASVTQAQIAYDRAVETGGRSSSEARSAAVALQAAQDNLEAAQIRAKVSTVLVAAEVVNLATQAPKAIRAVQGMAAAARAWAVAQSAATVAATGGLAVLGLVAGYMALDKAMGQVSSSTPAATQALEEQREKLHEMQEEYAEFAQRAQLEFRPEGDPLQLKAARDREAIEQQKQSLEEYEDALREEAQAFRDSERQRVLVASGGERQVQEAYRASVREVEGLREALRQPMVENRAELTKDLDEAVRKMEELQGVIEKTDQMQFTTLMRGLQGVGASIQQLTVAGQVELLQNVGIDPDLITQLSVAAQREEEFAGAALRSSEALRDQTSITARKDETTEAFTERLQMLGFTEAEIAERVDETGRRLLSQADATRAAAAATVEAQSVLDNAFRRDQPLQGTGGAGGRVAITGSVDAPLRAERQVLGVTPQTEAGAMLDELQLAIHRNPGIQEVPEVQDYLGFLTTITSRQGIGFHGGTLRKTREAALPFIPAAKGFNGDVTGPTLFLAGEAGRESVNITPGGGGGAAPSLEVHVHLAPGEGSAADVEAGAVRGALRGAALLGVNARRRGTRRAF